MYAYIMQKGNIVKSKETSINYSSSNTTYTFPLTGKASDLESYFVFSPSKEWVFDDNQELNEEQPPKRAG